MYERTAASLIIATALALLAMGWMLTRTTGATVVGSLQPGAYTEVQLRWDGAARAAAGDGFTSAPVPGRSAQGIVVIPDGHALSRAVVSGALARERARAEPRQWTLTTAVDALRGDDPAGDTPSARALAVVLVEADAGRTAGTLRVVAVGGGRATAPWLRRAVRIAGQAAAVSVGVRVGWGELAARAGVRASRAAPYLRPPVQAAGERLPGVPAIVLRVGVGDGGALDAGGTAALRVLLALLDQLQSEPSLPELGRDQFASARGTYLTPGATRWLWVFPLLPLTLGTAARYAAVATQPEFAPAVLQALRRLAWWCMPCLGAAVLLTAVPRTDVGPLPASWAAPWFGGVVLLAVFAARRVREIAVPAVVGGALVMDLLWTTYLIAVLVRPWTAGAWLAPAVLLWPWVMPVTGPKRVLVGLAWLGGAAAPMYWLLQVPGGEGSRVLAILGWLAGGVSPWGLVLGGFATAAGLSLGWWAATSPPVVLPTPTAARE